MLNDKRIKDSLTVTAEKKIIKCLQITCTLLGEIDRTFIPAFSRHAPILTPSDITIIVDIRKMWLAQFAMLRTPPPRRCED